MSVKYDLHRHLEGSHSAAALLDVARRFEVRAPLFYDATKRTWLTPEVLASSLTLGQPSDDATLFCGCITKARSAYVSVPAVRLLALHAFREAAHETDGLEMRVSLFSMTRTVLENQGQRWRDVAPGAFADLARHLLAAVLEARDEAQKASGRPVLVRLGLSRTFESEPHYAALAEVVIEQAAALVGLDVLGIVTGADTEPMPAGLVTVLERLRAHLPDLSIHAGEFAGAASVERTLAFAPQAIGHGVRSLESPATLERLAREGVTLEVCPSSNRLLIPSALAALIRTHGCEPLPALQRAHVHCVLGSDDPTPMRTSYSQEREVAAALGADLTRLDADVQRRWAQLKRPRV